MVLGTVWLSKYRDDPFFRTEVNVIALQTAFAISVLALIASSYAFLHHEIASTLNARTPTVLMSYHANDGLLANTQSSLNRNFAIIVAVVIFVTIIAGYLVARVTLTPARNALIAQKQFIGNIAHELRTPLSIVKTNIEIAVLDGRAPPEFRTMLASSVEELDRISEIINNLLSLSTLVKPERLTFTAVDLSKIVTQSVAKFSQMVANSNHEITVRKSPDLYVWGNVTALEQIVSNLVKNSISYTPRNGTIIITVAPAPNNTIELMIQDSGIGISRKDLFRIFEPFYRAEQSRTRSLGGTGLGLAIVSELIKIHQGKITIRSAVGRGTTVSAFFPAARAQAKVGGTEMYEGLNEIAVDFSGKRA